jgi:hypothetical protein
MENKLIINKQTNMKTIEAVSIWENGTTQTATILNAYAVNVRLNNSATFYYSLLSQKEDGKVDSQLAQGNLTMTSDDYAQWDADTFAWDWIASKLNITITGDYVATEPEETPGPEPIVEEVTE